jgi:hypothetical protein
MTSAAHPCNNCKRVDHGEDLKRLITGEQVCGYCERWRMECEARHLLTLKLFDRRKMLADRDRTRPAEHMNELRRVMTLVHAAK